MECIFTVSQGSTFGNAEIYVQLKKVSMTLHTMLYSLLLCLSLAVVIEIVVAFLLGVRGGRDLRLVMWTNCLTNPTVVYIMFWVLLLGNRVAYWLAVVVLELSVVWVEYKIYKKLLQNATISPLVLSVPRQLRSA